MTDDDFRNLAGKDPKAIMKVTGHSSVGFWAYWRLLLGGNEGKI